MASSLIDFNQPPIMLSDSDDDIIMDTNYENSQSDDCDDEEERQIVQQIEDSEDECQVQSLGDDYHLIMKVQELIDECRDNGVSEKDIYLKLK